MPLGKAPVKTLIRKRLSDISALSRTDTIFDPSHEIEGDFSVVAEDIVHHLANDVTSAKAVEVTSDILGRFLYGEKIMNQKHLKINIFPRKNDQIDRYRLLAKIARVEVKVDLV